MLLATLRHPFQAWDDDFAPESVAEKPPSNQQLKRPTSIGPAAGNVGVGVFARNKTPEGGAGAGVLGTDSPWLSGGMFVRNVTPDIGLRNLTPDIGGGAVFGGSGVLSSGRKLQDILGALTSLCSVRRML